MRTRTSVYCSFPDEQLYRMRDRNDSSPFAFVTNTRFVSVGEMSACIPARVLEIPQVAEMLTALDALMDGFYSREHPFTVQVEVRRLIHSRETQLTFTVEYETNWRELSGPAVHPDAAAFARALDAKPPTVVAAQKISEPAPRRMTLRRNLQR